MGEGYIWRKCITNVYARFKICTTTLKETSYQITFVLFLYLSNPLSRIQLGKMVVGQLLLMLLSHLYLCFRGAFLPSFLATEVVYAFLTRTIHSTCHTYPVLQAFITLVISATWPNVHKLRGPSECFFYLLFRVLQVCMRIFGPRRDEVTGDWRRLHNE